MLSQKEILSRFNHVKPHGSKKNCFKAECPCHASKGKASLVITFKEDKVLFLDNAECRTEDILSAVGLTWTDVMMQSKKEFRPYPWYERMLYGFNKNNGGGWIKKAVYDYTDVFGKYLYSKVRFERDGEKEIRYYIIDRENDTYKAGRRDNEPTLYNLRQFLWAVSEGNEVYYVEGEKDVETLRNLNMTAVTAGSVKDWKKDFARYFKGAKLTILADNDAPGEELANTVTSDIRLYAYWRQICTPSRTEKGDVTDYLSSEGGTKESLRDMITALHQSPEHDLRYYGDWLIHKWETDKDGAVVGESVKVNLDMMAHVFSKGNHYLITRRGEEPKDELYLYNYDKGLYELTNRNALKAGFKQYMPLGTAGSNSLNSVTDLFMSTHRNVIRWEQLNDNENYINCRNGLYSIRDRELMKHSPRIRNTYQVNANYIKGGNCEDLIMASRFNKYMTDLCMDSNGNYDPDRENLLQEYAGLLVSNLNISQLKKMLILCSPRGDSGKSVFLNLLIHLIGVNRQANVPLQDMNEKNRFALGALKTARLLQCGDQTGAAVEDSSIIKQLTGGDNVKTERKNVQAEYIAWKGGIVICCNMLPTFSDDKGDHLFDRMLIVPLENHFGKDTADPTLTEKLKEEADIIFMWALEGLHRFIDNGYKFTECGTADKYKTEYRERLDTLFRFIHEAGYVITREHNDIVSKSAFEEQYWKWCSENEFKELKRDNIKTRMEQYGCKASKGNIGDQRGISIYRGIKLSDSVMTGGGV